jgi:hypothetical protein
VTARRRVMVRRVSTGVGTLRTASRIASRLRRQTQDIADAAVLLEGLIWRLALELRRNSGRQKRRAR